jgi:hypothetical protein
MSREVAMSDDHGSYVPITDQLGQRLVIRVYTIQQWERLPPGKRPANFALTHDGLYMISVTDAPDPDRRSS